MTRFLRVTLMMLLLMTAFAGNATACAINVPVCLREIMNADVIFKGELLKDDLVSGGTPNIIQFRVLETYKGEHLPIRELYWQEASSNRSEEWGKGRTLIVGGYMATESQMKNGGAYGSIMLHPEIMQVMDDLCSDPFLFPYKPKTEAKVIDLISGSDPESKQCIDWRN